MPLCWQPFAISIHVYMCVHACVYMHMHVHMCGDTPMPPDTHPPTCSLPRAAGSPKDQNSISLELIKIISILFKDSLPLNTPEPIYTIVGHPRYPHPPAPPPELRKPKSEELQ